MQIPQDGQTHRQPPPHGTPGRRLYRRTDPRLPANASSSRLPLPSRWPAAPIPLPAHPHRPGISKLSIDHAAHLENPKLYADLTAGRDLLAPYLKAIDQVRKLKSLTPVAGAALPWMQTAAHIHMTSQEGRVSYAARRSIPPLPPPVNGRQTLAEAGHAVRSEHATTAAKMTGCRAHRKLYAQQILVDLMELQIKFAGFAVITTDAVSAGTQLPRPGLIWSWPELEPYTAEALDAFQGDHFSYVGEADHGGTGSSEFHDILNEKSASWTPSQYLNTPTSTTASTTSCASAETLEPRKPKWKPPTARRPKSAATPRL